MDAVEFNNHAEQVMFNSQAERNHVATRWYDQDTAEGIGMHNDIMEAFEYIGASSLLEMDYPAYPALSSEFLSSLDSTIDGPSSMGRVKFRLGNQTRRLTLAGWNEIFGFTNPTQDYHIAEFKLRETWCLLTGMNYLPTETLPMKKIASPLFRVIFRILGNTVWARRDNARPTKKELACVHGMLFVPRTEMNMGWELLKQLMISKEREGDMLFGGLITRLSMHFGVDLTHYQPLEPNYIDLQHLLLSKIIVDRHGILFSKEEYGHMVGLTAPRMDLLHVPNWYEEWTGRQRNHDAPSGWNPDTNVWLRRRERRVYDENEEVSDGQEDSDGSNEQDD